MTSALENVARTSTARYSTRRTESGMEHDPRTYFLFRAALTLRAGRETEPGAVIFDANREGRCFAPWTAWS